MEYFFLIIVSLTLYLVSKKINTLIFDQSNNILINTFIFSCFFLIIYLIFAYFFIFGLSSKIIAYIIICSIFLCSFLTRYEIINLVKNFKFKYIRNNKILSLAIILYFLLILFPAYDQDSLRYHLTIAKKINNNTFYINTWLDYIYMGAPEFINSFSLHLNFEKISSYSNFIFLFFIIFSNYYILKKYKVGSGILSGFIILGSPYLISLLSSQKIFLMPCYIVSYSLAYLYLEKKNLNIKILYLILSLSIFCVVTKPIFIPYLGLIGLWSLYKIKNYKNRVFFCFFGIIFAIICYTPIYIINLKIYNDPFLIYFSTNINNFEWFSEYKNFMSSIRMDHTVNIAQHINNETLSLFFQVISVPIKLIIPFHYSDISRTLGLGFLFIFLIDYKKNKNILYLIILFIISVVVTQSFQSRWFLPLLIFISIFANVSKINYLFKFIKLQTLCVILVLIPLSSLAFLESFNIIDKKIILDKFQNSHLVVEKLNKKYKGQKIFSTLNDYYYIDGVVPVYYPNIVIKFDKNFYRRNESVTNLILWTGTRYGGVENFVKKNFVCKEYEKIEEFNYNSRRLYPFENNIKLSLYKLGC